MKRKIFIGITVLAMVASLLTGCGQKAAGGKKVEKTTASDSSKNTELTGKLDIGDIRPELIYGNYLVNRESPVAFSKDYVSFMDGVDTMDFDNEGTIIQISKVPMEFDAGKYGYNLDDKNFFGDYPTNAKLQEKCDELVNKYGEDGVAYFQNYKKLIDCPYIYAKYIYVPETGFNAEDVKVATMEGFYTIDGNTVTIYWDTPDPVTYELKYEKPAITFDYEFKNGINLTVSNQGAKVNMLAQQFSDAELMNIYISSGYIAGTSGALEDIIYIRKVNDDFLGTDLIFADGRTAKKPNMDLKEDGTFKLTWEGKKATHSFDVEETAGEISGDYIFADSMGLILLVDGKTYYYTNTETNYFGSVFDNIEISELSDDVKDDLVVTQINIKNELTDAFAKAGIQVTIDEKTGEVRADDSILFGVDEAEISDEGKEYLDTFIDVYTDVVLSYVEKGYIAEIEISGHTDTSGTYDHNLELSNNRAKAVADYCLEKQPALGNVIESKGFAYEHPVLDANGNVDMKASRRVVFTFKMGIGKQ